MANLGLVLCLIGCALGVSGLLSEDVPSIAGPAAVLLSLVGIVLVAVGNTRKTGPKR